MSGSSSPWSRALIACCSRRATADAPRCRSNVGSSRCILIGSAMIGLELLSDGAIAVAVDEDGRLVALAEERGASDLVAAAMAALGRLPAGHSETVALACAAPGGEWCATAVSALGRQPGVVVAGPAVASGVAAASAEAWSGAARGA